MMIVLRSTQTLPPLRASEIPYQSRIEVGDPSPRVTKRVRTEVAPEVEIDPLKVVGRIVRNEYDRAPGLQPFPELPKCLLRTVGAMKGFHPAISKGVDIHRTELRHVSDGGRSDAERRFTIDDDQATH